MTTSARFEPDPKELARRRRRRRVIAAGAGGTSLLVLWLIYIALFVGITVTQRAITRLRKQHPQAKLQRDPSGYVMTISNLEATTASRGVSRDGVGRFAVDFMSDQNVSTAM